MVRDGQLQRKLLCELLLSVLGLFAPASAMAQRAPHSMPESSSATNQIALFQDTAAGGCLMGVPATYFTGFNGLVFLLQGNEPMLKSYVGHEVVLTGIPAPGPASIKPGVFPGTSVLDFGVEFINDLGSHCTGGGGPPINLEALATKEEAAEEAAAAAAAKAEQRAAAAAARVHPAAVVNMTGELLKFLPATIEIKAGQTVLWKNSSQEPHTVTADPHQATNAADVKLPQGAQPFDSGYLNPGQNYQHTFTTPGIYRYVCTLHEVQGMIGEVIVKPKPVHTAEGF